jgi:hypothetical protein
VCPPALVLLQTYWYLQLLVCSCAGLSALLVVAPSTAFRQALSGCPTAATQSLLQHVGVSAWPVAAILWVLAVGCFIQRWTNIGQQVSETQASGWRQTEASGRRRSAVCSHGCHTYLRRPTYADSRLLLSVAQDAARNERLSSDTYQRLASYIALGCGAAAIYSAAALGNLGLCWQNPAAAKR